jgi:hypothetical protein
VGLARPTADAVPRHFSSAPPTLRCVHATLRLCGVCKATLTWHGTPAVPNRVTRRTMCCHYQLARSPAPSSPRHENRDDPREGTAAARTGAHEQRSRIHGIGALAMFALWRTLPWLLAVLICRRRDDGDLQPNGRPGRIRQIFAVVLWHKHFYQYARDTSKQLRALIRELRQSERPNMRRSTRDRHGRGRRAVQGAQARDSSGTEPRGWGNRDGNQVRLCLGSDRDGRHADSATLRRHRLRANPGPCRNPLHPD